MIKARHSNLYIWFFRNFFGAAQLFFFRDFKIVSKVVIPADQAVLLFQNHFSWWDGYWSYLLSKKLFHRKFHVMMLENQLKKRIFLSRCGVFSIKKGHRDLFESLQYSKNLLKDPCNLVTIYPSGSMLTQHQQQLKFQRGIEKIVNINESTFSIVLAVILVDFFGFPRPEIRVYLHNFTGEHSISAIENAYAEFYQSCVTQQTE